MANWTDDDDEPDDDVLLGSEVLSSHEKCERRKIQQNAWLLLAPVEREAQAMAAEHAQEPEHRRLQLLLIWRRAAWILHESIFEQQTRGGSNAPSRVVVDTCHVREEEGEL